MQKAGWPMSFGRGGADDPRPSPCGGIRPPVRIRLDNRTMTEQDDVMNKPSKNHDTEERKPGTGELLRLIERLVDGIDGYQSEPDDLRYWSPKAVEEARQLVGVSAAVR